MTDLNAVLSKAVELNGDIRTLLRLSTYHEDSNLDGLAMNYEDGEQLFILDELKFVMDKLADVHDRISYLAQPVKEVNKLHKNSGGRYETPSGHYYTSGSRIEALISDDYHEVPYWARTSVEHNGEDYYLVGFRGVPLEGLTVRVREVQ